MLKSIGIVFIFAVLLCSCSMNHGDKDIPDSHRHGLWHFMALIWDNDSLNSKSPPLEAVVTINNQYITFIESSDEKNKTNKNYFKPARIYWDKNDPGSQTGTFKILDKTYKIQITEDLRIQLPSDGDTSQNEKQKVN